MRKFILVLLVLGVCGYFVYRLWEEVGTGEAAGPRGRRGDASVAIEVAPVTRGPIRDVRVFTGTLQPRARFLFAPKIGGRLESMAVNIGDPVAPGQLIARIDDEEYRQQVNQARAALEVAEATMEQQATALDLARREMKRVEALRDKQIASEAEWDQAEGRYKAEAAKLKVAEAQAAERRSALRTAEVHLSYARVHAPAAGEDAADRQWFVEERYVDEGALLVPNAPLASVVALSHLTAVIHVIERDYPALAEGLTVAVATDAYPDRSFPGVVTRIAPVLREASRQARVEIQVPNPELLLRPGMFIRAHMEFARREDARLVPRSALVKREGADGVFVVDAGDAGDEGGDAGPVARFVPVRVGIRDTASVEILEPALAGPVVTLGQHMLAEGTKVILPAADGPSTAADASPAGARGGGGAR
ncbi:MAG: efflux RND transporter periplasmic adaptor subunit [Planctomycetota bacterium]